MGQVIPFDVEKQVITAITEAVDGTGLAAGKPVVKLCVPLLCFSCVCS